MADFPYTLKQIAEITGKSNTALFAFIKSEQEFINLHSQKNGRFVKYDEDALQAFIKRYGRVDKDEEAPFPAAAPLDDTQQNAEPPSNEGEGEDKGETKVSIIEAFEAQIDALKKERDELTAKLEARERDCADWRAQAGQALTALGKEQERAERLEERLAGYLPPPTPETAVQTTQAPRKLTFGQRIKVLFGHELDFK